ncbi:MAG: D-alanyl-D-alanine carboxypeptidase, partial [Oscillospiraceae bacterium]|nr:D-alanyl-D-alanine carboxypeptidase [Oscillospiraceae bacterium]
TGLKTGSTDSAGYCLSATAERDGMELIAVVLGSETSEQRFESAKSLLNYGFNNYTLLDVYPDQALPTVEVLLGERDTVQPVLKTAAQVLVDKADADKVTTQLTVAESVAAPVESGQKLGTLTVYVDGVEQLSVDLVADAAVERLTVKGIFSRMLGILLMKGQ